MEEEFIYPSDEELAASFVDDLFSAFMVEIKRYPVLSIEEQKELARKYKNGDMSAREKLINHNLRLVVYIASAYKDKIKHLKIMDIIQEGTIGLIKAVDKYNPEIGALSTYAIPWIRQAITRSIDDVEDEIRKPVHIAYKIRKYRRILAEAERNNTEIPSDKELMKMLDCKKEALDLIKKKAFETVISAQTKVGDEEDSELGDFIADKRNDFDDAINTMDDQELLVVLKNELLPIEYYFLYNYEIDKKSDDATLDLLAKDFNITRERVRQLKNRAYKKSAVYVKNKKLRHMKAQQIINMLGVTISKLMLTAYDIDNIVVYNILKSKVSELERRILAYILFSDLELDNNAISRYFKLLEKEYTHIVKKLRVKVVKCRADKRTFNKCKKKIVNMYGTKILSLVPEDEVKMSFASGAYVEKMKLLEEKKHEDVESVKEVKFDPYIKDAQKRLEDINQKPDIDILEMIDIKDHDLLAAIKMRLTPFEYYVFYRLLKNQKNVDIECISLAKSLNLSFITLNAHKNKIEKKIEGLIGDKDFVVKEAKRLADRFNTTIDNIKIEPLDPRKIILMAYVQEYLTDLELQILKMSIYSPTKDVLEKDLELLGISIEEYQKLSKQLDDKIIKLVADAEDLKKFKRKILLTYGTRIFNMNFDKDFNNIDYDDLKQKFDSLSFEEIKELYGDSWDKLDINSQNLLKRYFMVPKNTFVSKEKWEEAFYLELNNIHLNNVDSHLKPNDLYECYLENKEKFSKETQKLLECFVFEIRDKSEYLGSKNRQEFAVNKSFALDKLEKIYFNVYNFLYSFDFTKEQWLKVLEKHENKFSENRIIAMNMFYGVDGDAMSIPEIAEIFGMERNRMHDYIANIRKTAMALYTNRSNLRDIDEDIYIPYALNKAFRFTDLTRKILIMYLVQELSYAEIKEELKDVDIELSQYQISNIITEGIRKIDFYRFGIIDSYNYNETFINHFIEVNKRIFKEKDQRFIRDKYLKHIDNDTLASMYHMPKLKVNKQVQRFNILLNNFQIEDVVLTEADYLKEFNAYPVERVVNEQQMHMLSYYYGIRCIYNLEGVKLSTAQMINTLSEYANDNVSGLSRKINKANDLIKLKKKKLYHNDLIFMSTDEMTKIMADPHVPISDKEKHIICSIYGIRRFKQKTLKDLVKFYGEGEYSIRRRYQRAMVSIFKYQRGEIPAKIDYEYDILPLMRYFSKYDRLLIEDSYKNKLSYEKISKKYKLTFNQVVTRFNKLHLQLFEMINYPKNEYFDFDFYEKAIKDPLLPFYGNLEEATKIFDLRFANNQIRNYTGKEIALELNLNRDEKSVNKTVYNLIMAVCRYKKGIRKEHSFTYEDVKDYYMRHKDEMTATHEKFYLVYFKRHLKEDANRNKELINKIILMDLIKERNRQFENITELDHDEIINLINHSKFSTKVLHSLLNKIGETEKVAMSGQELNHVYRLLNRLDKTVKLKSNQALKKA